ncbi:amino acid ABC transporter permease [Pseudonocardia sulfidoxydans NBRC 16205]|uniref:Amino acid ABC transporter permease n=1 Tax=Pseudonocardia sulfidoxydans NBRC 16205 TaxID=1223511 RepID=A0A511DPF0_9PSEU|nr:ABC transporter permease [Pseudonocardia sulfidoxydans]GEL26691.1 amino acid ABC transporter permease [Pseudonocardia sulfidoxydans NBRC 16205]
MTTQVSQPASPVTGPLERAVNARKGKKLTTGRLGVIGLVVVLGAWQVTASAGWVDASFASSPVGAVKALAHMIGTGELWPPLLSTLESVAYGMIITVVVGIPLGLLIGRSNTLYGLTEPLVSIMYSVPFVVFLPIIIFWFGIGAEARLVIVVWSAIFPLLINVIAGARNVDMHYLQVAKVFCAPRLLTLRSVTFPATLPFVLTGVRQSVGRALVGAIVAELFMGNAGLGYVVQTETSAFKMDDAMAAIVVIAVLAIVLTRSVAWIERRFTFWSSSV